MKITNLRRESVNTMTVEIDGQKFRIHSYSEITSLDQSRSIPDCLDGAESLDEIRSDFVHYGLTLNATK